MAFPTIVSKSEVEADIEDQFVGKKTPTVFKGVPFGPIECQVRPGGFDQTQHV